MTEDELLTGVGDLLTRTGWRWQHVRNSKAGVIQGHVGMPDIVAVKGGRVMALELKSDKGRVTAQQQAWMAALQIADVDARVVRPSDYDDLVKELTNG